MRILTYALGILFLLFGAVQLNDPDPLIWVLAYIIPAIASFTLTHVKLNKYIFLAIGLFYLVAAISLFPPSLRDWISAEDTSQSFGMTLPGIEEARESMGLIICFFTFVFFFLYSKKRIG